MGKYPDSWNGANKGEQKYLYTLAELSEMLSKKLSAKRLEHSHAVAYTAASIAMYNGVQDLMPFLYAGLLHDCAKFMYGEEFLVYCRENGLEVPKDAEKYTPTLHGIVGADMAAKEYGITDPDILNAIAHHTDGRAGMSFLEKAIHIADHIEPMRSFDMEPPLSEIRRLAFLDLDMSIYLMDKAIIDYLEGCGKVVTAQAYETVAYFEKLISER
jgi:predicted HD superfamily hydrolase involved in NAD metabolism